MADEEQIILPERFKRLEYLEDTGSQWIDTGYIPKTNSGMWIDAQQTTHSNGHPMGSGQDTNSPADGFTIPRWLKSTGNSCGFGWGGWTSWGNIGNGKRFNSSLNYLNSKKAEMIIDGTVTKSNSLGNLSFTPSKSIFLFCTNLNGKPPVNKWKGKIFEAKISEGTNVVRHFIPAFDKILLEPCMYDVITSTAFYNVGSGRFGYNSEDTLIGITGKLPKGFTYVEYLLATGSEYIDTNYIPTNETGYHIKGQFYSTTEGYYFGLIKTINSESKRIYFGGPNAIRCGWNTEVINLVTNGINLRQEDIGEFNFLNSRKAIIKNNETEFSVNLANLEFTPDITLFLFAINKNDNEILYPLKGRIDRCIISEGNEIVRDFVPCLDEEGTPCMYELYTGTAHYNKGGGRFYYPHNYPSERINLPAGYTKCVYLQSSGTQYINTGITPTIDTGVYIEAQSLGYGDTVPFGTKGNSSTLYTPPRWNTSNRYSYWGFGSAQQQGFYYDKADDLIYKSSLNLYNDRLVSMVTEDTEWRAFITTDFITQLYPLWLFSYNVNGSTIDSYGKFVGRIFRAKITQGDTLIHDFVPCLDNSSTPKPCMYDLVTDTPYYNKGTGNFSYCIEHELPSNFAKLDYIESTGTQIIKTGIVPTNNTGIYVDAYHTKYNGDTDWSVIGLRNTNGNTYFTVGRVQRDTNGAGFGWGAFTTPGGNGNVRYEASLNWLNDKKSIITAPAFAQRTNTLSTLSFTPTKDLYMFGMNNYDGAATVYSTYRIYRAKISEGSSSIVRDFVPAYDEVKSKPCMYDLINNVPYYNDGTGEFIMPAKREGTYKGFALLSGIGNRLGYGEPFRGNEEVTIPDDYTILDFIQFDDDTPEVDTQVLSGNGSLFIYKIGAIYDYDSTSDHTSGHAYLQTNNGSESHNYMSIGDDMRAWGMSNYYNQIIFMYNSEISGNEFIEIEIIESENPDEADCKINGIPFEIKEVNEDYEQPELNENYLNMIFGARYMKIYYIDFYDARTNEVISKMKPVQNENGEKGLYCTVRNIFLPIQTL